LKIKPALKQPDPYSRGDGGESNSKKAKHQTDITESMKRIVTPMAIQVISI
jgi:hypothetical protein